MSLLVKKAGFLAQLNDLGRYGQGAQGLTHGGPMDEIAHRWANWMVNNPDNSPVIEITYGQFELVCQQNCEVAITGGDLGVTLNGQALSTWQTQHLSEGDVLSFNAPVIGMRAYVALAGGIVCESKFGSVSTVAREHVGGLQTDGSALKAGNALKTQTEACQSRPMPTWAIPNYSNDIELRVIAGYQFKLFEPAQVMSFLTSTYTVTDKINRMGFRLEGTAINCSADGIVSEGIALGAVQIPSDGQPIVLLRDRQTIGGYPKIGTVFSLDLSLLAQTKPGDRVRFSQIDLAEAENERQLFERNFTGE